MALNIVFLLLCFVYPAYARDSYGLWKGNRYYLKGDYSKAEQTYKESEPKQMPSDEPNTIDVDQQFNLGNAQFKQDKLEEAAQSFSQAAKSDPSGDALYNLGNTRIKQYKNRPNESGSTEAQTLLEEAVKAYQQSLFKRPGMKDAQKNLELALSELDKLKNQNQKQNEKPPSDQQDAHNQDPKSSDKNQPDKNSKSDKNHQNSQNDPDQHREGEGDKDSRAKPNPSKAHDSNAATKNGESDQVQPMLSKEQMAKLEAERLLEKLSNEEKLNRQKNLIEQFQKGANSHERDW